MFVPFDTLPDNARVWVYPISRTLNDQEADQLEAMLESFVQKWLSHQREVHGSGLVLENRFVVLAADESMTDVSGCSIDSSVRFIREVEQAFGVSCFDRSHIYFQGKSGGIDSLDFREIKTAWDKGLLDEHSYVFNLQAAHVEDIRTKWMLPLVETPFARFLPLNA
jgi:sugar phosphate isomerase/epimerase